MRIFNVMMNRELGGLEQAFLDYNKSLALNGHQIINVTSSFAKINRETIKSIKLPNLFPWCVISKIYLKILILIHNPDLIITHGGRAINFTCSVSGDVPVAGVSHSYGTKHILKCDYIIALDESLKAHIINKGYNKSKIFVVPNMVDVKPVRVFEFPKNKKVLTIGGMGRFVHEKGFAYLIEAIKILKDKNYDVELILGGGGQLDDDLKKLVSALNLQNEVHFIGWVKNKTAFFNKIDIFCIPSTFETFGIVALESMSYGVPTIATNTGGLKNIINHQVDGLLAEVNSAIEIANSIEYMINNPSDAKHFASNARAKILDKYDAKKIACTLSDAIKMIV